MSLVVWLPLLGNLNNQGLSELTITSGTAKYKTGKIGQGLDLSSRVMFNCPDLSGCEEFSVCFWAKIEDDENITTNWQDIIGFTDEKADGSQTGKLRAETYYQNAPTNWGIHWHDNTTNAIGQPSVKHYDRDRGIWHHCAICVNSSNLFAIYTDGVLLKKNTTDLYGGHLTGVFWLGETNNIAGVINDVRIYNHVLSPREVKSISQACVLHYKLDRGGFGQDNLLAPQISDAKWTDWSASTTWSSENTREKIVDESGKTWAHIIQNSSTGYGGYACAPNNNEIIIDPTKKYVISALAKSGTKENSRLVFWCHWRSTEGGANLYQNSTYCELTSAPKRVYTVWTPNGGTSGYTPNRINLMIGTSGLANNEVYFTDVKFEEGKIATPWTPNSSDSLYSSMGLDDNVVYDVSGYGHNGTASGVTYSADTAKYSVSTSFDGVDDEVKIQNLDISTILNNQCTISFWIKPNGENGGRSIYFSAYSGVSWCIEKTGGNKLRLYWNGNPDFNTNLPIADDEWQFIAITKNGTDDVKVYLNGELIQSITREHSDLNFATTWRLGKDYRTNDGTPYKGLMSDFRLYATALSADDIEALYQVPISLSSNGTLFAGEYVEG